MFLKALMHRLDTRSPFEFVGQSTAEHDLSSLGKPLLGMSCCPVPTPQADAQSSIDTTLQFGTRWVQRGFSNCSCNLKSKI